MLIPALQIIGLSEDEIKIYLELLESGQATAGELAKRLGIVRPTVYNYLQKMTDKGVVERSLKHGIRSFSAQSPDKLDRLFEAKQKEIEQQRNNFKIQIPQLMGKFGKKNTPPKIKIFEGEEIKNIFNDIINYRDIDTYSFWPVNNILQSLGHDYWIWNNRERVQNNTRIFAIRPESKDVSAKEAPYTAACKELLREVRIAPKEIDFSMGYWIYKNKVAMLSSTRERIGFIIESEEMIEMLKTQWKFIWAQSKPYKSKLEHYKEFLKKFF
jgi:sugar-specific transcriptional regulator TrmB